MREKGGTVGSGLCRGRPKRWCDVGDGRVVVVVVVVVMVMEKATLGEGLQSTDCRGDK